jgi:hypothetical protein
VNANKTMKRQAVPNHRRRQGKKVQSNIDSAAYNQTLKKQKTMIEQESPHTYQYLH